MNAADYPRCKTCKWWMPLRDGSIDVEHVCSCPLICEGGKDDKSRADQLVYSYDEGGRFYAGPDFGCVHHETKGHGDG